MTTADAMTASDHTAESYRTVESYRTAEGYRTAEDCGAPSDDRIVKLAGLTPACSTTGATE